MDNYSVCDHLPQFHLNFFKGVRQCRPEDHPGGVLVLPPSEVRQATGHLSPSRERCRKWGTQPPGESCAQEEGTAGIEQDEEVTNMTLAMFYFYIPNFQLKQGYFSSFQSQWYYTSETLCCGLSENWKSWLWCLQSYIILTDFDQVAKFEQQQPAGGRK